MKLLEQTFWGNTLWQWAVAATVAVISAIILQAVLSTVRSRLAKLTERTTTVWDNVLVHALLKVRFWLVYPLLLTFALGPLSLPDGLMTRFRQVATVLLLIQAGVSASAAAVYWLDNYRTKRLATDPGSVSGFGAIKFLANFVVWTIAVLVALDNVGVDVSTLVTGLGVSGIAVALAVQNILGDLFASLTIILDKPFVVGDFLKVGDYLGSVQQIGLKTTRLRSLSGEQLVFSNSDLLQSRIQNYGRMQERRVSFVLGVTYQTSPDDLEQIPEIIKAAVTRNENTRFDRSHFAGFGDFALRFETVYFIDSPDYNLFMDRQQAIFLELTRAFAARGIEFAYPTQTIFVSDNRVVDRPAGEAT